MNYRSSYNKECSTSYLCCWTVSRWKNIAHKTVELQTIKIDSIKITMTSLLLLSTLICKSKNLLPKLYIFDFSVFFGKPHQVKRSVFNVDSIVHMHNGHKFKETKISNSIHAIPCLNTRLNGSTLLTRYFSY